MATKVDLIENLSNKLKYLTHEDSSTVVNTIIDYLKDELIKGSRVEIRGFGSISIRKRKYAGKDQYYNIIYYRMSKNLYKKLK